EELQGRASLGLAPDWAIKLISQVGNYGEIFAKHLGKSTALAIERGINSQWRDGGLIYAPPFR
ncbi:MAG: amino acid ABC transporter substrate-binding protein, partial [Alphaproteobacteria bacterium]